MKQVFKGTERAGILDSGGRASEGRGQYYGVQ